MITRTFAGIDRPGYCWICSTLIRTGGIAREDRRHSGAARWSRAEPGIGIVVPGSNRLTRAIPGARPSGAFASLRLRAASGVRVGCPANAVGFGPAARSGMTI